MISSGWRANQCPACFSWNLASPGWSSGLGPTNLRSFLNQRAVPQRTSIGWEQDGRRMLGPSLPKSSWANMKVSLCVLQLTALTDLKSIRNGTVLLIPEHAARLVLPLMPPLMSLLRKFLCTPGGNSQASVLCQGFPASPGRSASQPVHSQQFFLLPHLISALVGATIPTDLPAGLYRFYAAMRLRARKCSKAQGKLNGSSKTQANTQS